jgi:hypothetical protein
MIEEVAGSRKYGCDLERAVFLTVLYRLFVSGSDRWPRTIGLPAR